jgi:hypothetical protein
VAVLFHILACLRQMVNMAAAKSMTDSTVFDGEYAKRRPMAAAMMECVALHRNTSSSGVVAYVAALGKLPLSGICANALMDIICRHGDGRNLSSSSSRAGSEIEEQCYQAEQGSCYLLFQTYPLLRLDCGTLAANVK